MPTSSVLTTVEHASGYMQVTALARTSFIVISMELHSSVDSIVVALVSVLFDN